MITNFIPHGVYEDIVNVLGQWKIIDMRSLQKMTNYETQYPNLLRRVRRLERHGLIKSITDGSKRKYIYLSDQGLKHTPFKASVEISQDNLTHDLITGGVLRTLLEFDDFFNGMMYHQLEQDKVFPDAAVSFSKFNSSFRVGIEVELTQKSTNRVRNKFNLYSKDNFFDYSLFITNKGTLYKTYSRILNSMHRDAQRTNILLYDDKLTTYKFNPIFAKCFYNGKQMSFEDIFR